MKIIPVIDILGGHVVHAVGGLRSEYRWVASKLTGSTRPEDVGQALCGTFGADDLYVADLDAIMGRTAARQAHRSLAELNVRLWVDAGVRSRNDVNALANSRIDRLIVGLETLDNPATMKECVQADPADRIVFSLDLRDGVPMCSSEGWGRPTAEQVADQVAAAGVSRIILLDLARVGRVGGTGTLPLARRLLKRYPELEIVVGGGIRGVDDLRTWRDVGVAGVLLATALHDGTIRPADLESLYRR